MNNVLYKVYMGKTLICCTLAMSTIIVALHSCMVTTCMCIYTRVSKNSRSPTVYVQNESSLVWSHPVLAQGIHHLQYKCPAMPLSMVVYATQLSICAKLSSRLTIACSICYVQLANTFTLNFGVYNYLL